MRKETPDKISSRKTLDQEAFIITTLNFLSHQTSEMNDLRRKMDANTHWIVPNLKDESVYDHQKRQDNVICEAVCATVQNLGANTLAAMPVEEAFFAISQEILDMDQKANPHKSANPQGWAKSVDKSRIKSIEQLLK